MSRVRISGRVAGIVNASLTGVRCGPGGVVLGGCDISNRREGTALFFRCKRRIVHCVVCAGSGSSSLKRGAISGLVGTCRVRGRKGGVRMGRCRIGGAGRGECVTRFRCGSIRCRLGNVVRGTRFSGVVGGLFFVWGHMDFFGLDYLLVEE